MESLLVYLFAKEGVVSAGEEDPYTKAWGKRILAP